MGILDWLTALSDGNQRRDLVDGTVIPARPVTRCTSDWDISLSWPEITVTQLQGAAIDLSVAGPVMVDNEDTFAWGLSGRSVCRKDAPED